MYLSTILYIVNENIKELTVLVSHATHSKFLIILTKCIMIYDNFEVDTNFLFWVRQDKKNHMSCRIHEACGI